MLTEALSSASKTPAWAACIFAYRAAMSARIGMLDRITGGNRERDKVIAVSSASEFFSVSRSASAAARDAGLSERFGF